MSLSNKSKKRSAAEMGDDPEMIELSIKGQDGISVFFKVRGDVCFQRLFKTYGEKKHQDYRTIEFLFNGRRINKNYSPNTLGMKNKDVIEAMLHFDGGGI